MTKIKSGERLIIESLKNKACSKQEVYSTTLEIYSRFKTRIQELQEHLAEVFERIDKRVVIEYRELGDLEVELKFGGDILYFSMHTNVFTFDPQHEISNLDYVRQEPLNGFFGMIHIYNFLADSIKYKRPFDIGYLIARIFINREKHFFVDGEKPLSFLYNDLETTVMDEAHIQSIIETAVLYALDFDLYAPPFQQVKELSVQDKTLITGNATLRTAKRLGFQWGVEEQEQ